METKFKIAKMPDGKPEIFYTLQGEGLFIGLPTIFIRTSTCNLHCVWCDTFYTWNFEGTKFQKEHKDMPKVKKEDFMMDMTVLEVIKAINDANPKCKNLVFTGGEPMIQQKAWIELMKTLRQWNFTPPTWHFQVETNATMPIMPEFLELIDAINCSPKLESSGNEQFLRDTKSFPQYVATPKATFKYVIVEPKDLEEVLALITKYNIPNERVILMPEGRNPQEVMDKSIWLAEICKENGFRFSSRLHVLLWGAKRAV